MGRYSAIESKASLYSGALHLFRIIYLFFLQRYRGPAAEDLRFEAALPSLSYFLLDIFYWILDISYWILDIENSILDISYQNLLSLSRTGSYFSI